MKNLIPVSKSNPCIHCGADKWCYSLSDDLVCCKRQTVIADGWRKTSKQDKDGAYYYARISSQTAQGEKPTVVKSTSYEYLDRNGSPLVRYQRLDYSDDSKKGWAEAIEHDKWLKTTSHIPRQSIPIYQYAEVQQAILNKETIYFVEGEACVESLRSLGLIATTNWGGSGRLSDSDLDDLVGASLVICPDRDTPGLKLANQVAARFPAASWLYAFPDSGLWANVPPNKGADVKDWIRDYKLTAQHIIDAVEPRRETNTENHKLQLLGFSDVDKEKLTQIRDMVDGCIDQKSTEAEKMAFLVMLAKSIGWQEEKLKSYYHLRLKELEQEESQEEVQSEIEKTLESMSDDIDLATYLDPCLVPYLKILGDKLKYKQSSILTAIMTAVSILHRVGTEIHLADDWDVSPNIFSLLVSPSGQGKSPLMKALITQPFTEIERRFMKEWEGEIERSAICAAEFGLMTRDEQRNHIAEHGLPKKPPATPKILFATDLNTIAVNKQFRTHPEQGFMGMYDEARKLFNFKAGGRGDDQSNLCSLYDGSGNKELRAGEDRGNIAQTLFGIYGGIQPQVLLDLMGEGDDSQGSWARFYYTFQPKEAKVYNLQYTDKSDKSLRYLLAALYDLIIALPKRSYTLTQDGQDALSYYLTNVTEAERMRNSDNVMETFMGKSGTRVAKLIINLHVIKGKAERATTIISAETVYHAIHLDDYYTNQMRILYSKSRAQKGDLAPKLVEIIRIAQAAKEAVTARQVAQQSWIFKKDKDSTDNIRGYFRQLEEMGHGVCTGVGSKVTFKAN